MLLRFVAHAASHQQQDGDGGGKGESDAATQAGRGAAVDAGQVHDGQAHRQLRHHRVPGRPPPQQSAGEC